MKEKEFLELFKEALEVDDRELSFEDIFRDYEEWDSLAFLSLQALINDEYDITIPRAEFDNVQTVAELYSLIESKQR